MFNVKYFLSLSIPLATLVIYSITLQQDPRLARVARYPSSKPTRSPLRAVSRKEISTDELASMYELFLLEEWCSVRCETNAAKELKTRFRCTDVSVLSLLHSVQAQCPVIRSMSPEQVETNVVKKITGMKGFVNNFKLPSASIGERVHVRTLSTRPPRHKKPKSFVSRFIQSIAEMLPWGLDRIDQTTGEDGKFDLSCFPNLGKGVVVYVLDTGCRNTHEDIKGRTRIEKVGRYQTATDNHGHGTHVAGTAAGTNYGVCKQCDIVCIKTLDENNIGTIVDVVDAVEYVLEQKKTNPDIPAVAVMSLGGALETNVLDLAVNKLAEANVFPAVSAGNGFSDACEWTPPRAEHAITVGATMQNDELRFSSNFGKCVKIVAPGEEIRSASHEGDSLYVTMSGTSMAAPYVAGVAALILGEDSELTPAQVLEKMKLKAKIVDDDLHESTYPLLRVLNQNCELYGFRALASLSSTSTASPSGSPSSTPSISPTSTLSASPIPLPSASPSVSTSPTPSISPSSTPSMSTSSTPSVSPSSIPSVSPSPTPSVSLSSTPSMSPSSASSMSPSPTPSISPSSTPSMSSSSTPSMSPSSTPSMSLSSTPSLSASLIFSPSASFSPSLRPSPKPSMLHSPMHSMSVSPVASKTTSASPTSSMSPIHPALASSESSPTVSYTPSISFSQKPWSSESPRPSRSASDSHPPSFSQTPVPLSSTHSSTANPTPSASTSHTISFSSSEEFEPSAFDKASASPTQDKSSLASYTPSPFLYPNILSTPEVSDSLTSSPVETNMAKVTPAWTHSRSSSPSLTVSPTFSQDFMRSPLPTNNDLTPSSSRKPVVGSIGPSASASPYRFMADTIS